MKKEIFLSFCCELILFLRGKNLGLGIRFEGRRCNECGEFELLDVRVSGGRIRREIVRKKRREERKDLGKREGGTEGKGGKAWELEKERTEG